MNVGFYLFLTVLFLFVFFVFSDDEQKKPKVKRIKKPNLDEMYRKDTLEIRDMFRESKEKLNEEYEKFLRKETE